MGQSTYTEEECAEVNDFLKACIRLIVAWMRKVPTILQKTLKDTRKDADIFLVDEDAAIVQSYPELAGVLQDLFCACHRSMRYYSYWDQNQQSF